MSVLNEYARAKTSGKTLQGVKPGGVVHVDESLKVEWNPTVGTTFPKPNDIKPDLASKIDDEWTEYYKQVSKRLERTNRLLTIGFITFIILMLTLLGGVGYLIKYHKPQVVSHIMGTDYGDALSSFFTEPLEPGEVRSMKIDSTCKGQIKSIGFDNVTLTGENNGSFKP